MTTSPVKRSVQALLSREEYQLLQDLRQRSPAQQPVSSRLTVGDGQRPAQRANASPTKWRL